MRVKTQAIKAARLQAGMSLRALASKAGIAHDTVMRIERGTQEPQARTVKKLADVLGLTVGDLLDWDAEGLTEVAVGELAA